MNRRTFLAAAAGASSTLVAGCAGFSTTAYSADPPLVEDPPAAVYVPSHVEGMEMVGMADAGDAKVAVSYSYPHRFWTVEQDGTAFETQQVDIGSDDTVHLMATVWEPETGVVVPNTGLSIEISTDEGLVSEEVVYPMLSQQMGFHYGANFPLDGNDVYDVRVSVGATSVERLGSLSDRLEEPAAATVSFDYREAARNEIDYTVFEESRRGQRDAIPPMSMEMTPVGRVPNPDSVAGEPLGQATIGDLVLRGYAAEADRFGDDPYLVVTAGTPYNDLVVPGMALSARVPGDGRAAFAGRLDPALDPELGFHYGATAPRLAGDDEVELTVEIPPQVARHEGYETAFLETGTVVLTG
ncbi:iron transporter [Salinigranum marinum]|uniref:iron transporter n=1 Tax=Salinigranum marinum TaxID=1515595 RepID=UPI002989BA7F|nr:iron transporter [Salinigranum marinum]